MGLNPKLSPTDVVSRPVLPTYVGLNLTEFFGRGCRGVVLPTYVGLNPMECQMPHCRARVLPTYVGLNLCASKPSGS